MLRLMDLLLEMTMGPADRWADGTYQRLGRAVKRVPVIPSELGVGAFKRGVAVGLGLLDAMAR